MYYDVFQNVKGQQFVTIKVNFILHVLSLIRLIRVSDVATTLKNNFKEKIYQNIQEKYILFGEFNDMYSFQI